MVRLTGIMLKHLIDVSLPQQPRWVGKTIDNEEVFIKFDHGALVVTFGGQTETYVDNLNVPGDILLTTEVMLLCTGLRVL